MYHKQVNHRLYDAICTINRLIIGCIMSSVQLTG